MPDLLRMRNHLSILAEDRYLQNFDTVKTLREVLTYPEVIRAIFDIAEARGNPHDLEWTRSQFLGRLRGFEMYRDGILYAKGKGMESILLQLVPVIQAYLILSGQADE